MRCIWIIKDEMDCCPTCQSVLITFDGKRMLCPSCAGREIDRLRKLVKRLTRRAVDLRQQARPKNSVVRGAYWTCKECNALNVLDLETCDCGEPRQTARLAPDARPFGGR